MASGRLSISRSRISEVEEGSEFFGNKFFGAPQPPFTVSASYTGKVFAEKPETVVAQIIAV